MVVVVVQFYENLVLSLNNGDGWIYLIILKILLTPNLHLGWLLTSLSLSATSLLCSISASQVFFGLPIFLVHSTSRSNAPLRELLLSFLNTCPYQWMIVYVAYLFYYVFL